jgi:hypothetical protein
MRILTGKDREQFEALLVLQARMDGTLIAAKDTILSLGAQVQQLQAACDRERQRADNAIDELLAMRGIAPVSVPPEPRDLSDGDPFQEDPDEVAKIEKRMMEQGYGAVLMGEQKG